MVFNPVIGGKASQSVEFTRLLQNNLLSYLHLTKHKGFEICIDSHKMDINHDGRTLFCAPIGSINCVHLSGFIFHKSFVILSANLIGMHRRELGGVGEKNVERALALPANSVTWNSVYMCVVMWQSQQS